MDNDPNRPDDSGEQEGEDRDSGTSGIVYLLTNEAMPGLVKIGMTKGDDPQVRIDQLYRGKSGVPLPFECVLAMRVSNARSAEDALHEAFRPNRFNPGREFFEIDPKQAIAVLRVIGLEDVTPEVEKANDDLPEEERDAPDKLRNRRPNLNFDQMGIPENSILQAVGREETIIVVGDRNQVLYLDEQMSLTKATERCFGFGSPPNYPRRYWSYKNRNLQDIFDSIFSTK